MIEGTIYFMNQKNIDKSTTYLSSWLKYRYESLEMPGFVVAIAYKNKIIFKEAYGYSNLEKKIKMQPSDVFRIASHSKTFTATAIMQLQEAGKLRIDDRAIQYVPWLKSHKDIRIKKVTIRQLLSHSAGVIRDGKNSDYWQLLRPFPTKEQFKKEFLETELIFDTNVKMKYSNFGFTLLGLVVEQVSGISYKEYVQKNIIDALNLKNTAPEYIKKNTKSIVTGYTRYGTQKKRIPIDNIDTNVMAPATGFCSNALDLCAYFSAHFVRSKKLLDDESKKEMQRPQWRVSNSDEEYGLGLAIGISDNKKLFGHGGGFPGQVTFSLCDPENEVVVVALTNSRDGEAEDMARGVMGLVTYFAENTDNIKPKYDMSQFEGRYINLWTVADFINISNKALVVCPDSWNPFSNPDEYEFKDKRTLVVKKANGYYAEGEELTFNLDENNNVISAVYAGSTLLPEALWNEQLVKKCKISLG